MLFCGTFGFPSNPRDLKENQMSVCHISSQINIKQKWKPIFILVNVVLHILRPSCLIGQNCMKF